MQDLAERMENFEYVATLSRETSPEWKGGKGYVHGIYEDLFADQRPAHFYLCGWKDMIHQARQGIADMGYDRKSIHVEIYG
jgi:CDP-4-dehydro-6-deoxyglucose reductase